MATFTISQPKSFKAEVPIPQLGSDPVLVPFEFNAFTHEELAKVQDDWVKQAPQTLDDSATNVDYIKRLNAFRAKQLKQLVKNWGFDDPYNDKNIANLINTVIGSDDAIIRAYFSELAKARLGN